MNKELPNEMPRPVVIMSKHLKENADNGYKKTLFEIWSDAMNEYADVRAQPLVKLAEYIVEFYPDIYEIHGMAKQALSAYKEGIDNNENKEG